MGCDDDGGSVVPAGPAWLLRDVTHVPGVLCLSGGRLRFVSTRRVVFDATPTELGLAATLARRGRYRVQVDGERLVLSVVRPSGATPVPRELLATITEADRVGTAGTDAARRWRELLGDTPTSAVEAGPRTGSRTLRALAALGPARRADEIERARCGSPLTA